MCPRRIRRRCSSTKALATVAWAWRRAFTAAGSMRWCTGSDLRVSAEKRDSVRGCTFPCMKKLIALLLFFQITGFTQSTDQGALKRLLAKGGFSGELNGKVRLTQLGTIQCGQTGYAVIYYEWEESNPPGAAIRSE